MAGGAPGRAPVPNVIVSAQGIGKQFGVHQVLCDVSLDVEAGELVCIIGPSGCGKSTLLRCLNLIERPDRGTVQVAGVSVSCDPARRWTRADERLSHRLRSNVGMVFQGFNLFPHRTVLDNVMLAPIVVKRLARAQAKEMAMTLLGKVGLAHMAGRYPQTLSGGQQQRAAIARALASEPRVILYDEPTSALDPELTDEVLSVMRGLDAEGMTQIVVTHEMRFARAAADRVVVMHDGRFVEIAPPQTLFARPQSAETQRFLKNFL